MLILCDMINETVCRMGEIPMKRAIAVLLVAVLLLSGCAGPAHRRHSGQSPVAAIRSAVAEQGSRLPNGRRALQREKGTLEFCITAPARGVCFSLEMNAAGLRHVFAIQIDAPGGCYPCTYTITGGDKPFVLKGHIEANTYPRLNSIVVDAAGDYTEAHARTLFTQYTPLLLSAVQEMLEECGVDASLLDFFPNYMDQSAARL